MKPTSDLVLGAIQFALNEWRTNNEIKKRDVSSLFLQSVTAAVVNDPSDSKKYQIKITFDYSPPHPNKEDLSVWVGFDNQGNYRFVWGREE